MRFDAGNFLRRKSLHRIQEYEIEIFLFVVPGFWGHSPLSAPASICRSFPKPDRMRVLTVPRG